jgi:hypothetical protein
VALDVSGQHQTQIRVPLEHQPAESLSQIPRQSAHEGGRVVSPTHLPPLPAGSTLIPVRG